MDTLLVGILPHNRGDAFMQTAKKAGANGGTVIMGRGSADNKVLQFLGLGDINNEIVYILVSEEQKARIREALVDSAAHEKPRYGVLFDVDITKFIKTGNLVFSGKVKAMAHTIANAITHVVGGLKASRESAADRHELVTVILNKGFADDAMAAARASGAGGGTIINAHGTGKEEDAKFFGVTIVPEKEMLMILVDKGKAAPVVEAIRALPCLAQPGSGIAFCTEVSDFTLLGRKK